MRIDETPSPEDIQLNTPTALHKLSATAGLVTVLSTAALVEPNPAQARDSTAFIKRDEMLNWLADHDRGLWIQMGEFKWFYARFADVCPGLSSTNSLVFDAPASGNIGRTSIVVGPGGGRCTIRAIAPSNGPPKNRNASVVAQPQTQ